MLTGGREGKRGAGLGLGGATGGNDGGMALGLMCACVHACVGEGESRIQRKGGRSNERENECISLRYTGEERKELENRIQAVLVRHKGIDWDVRREDSKRGIVDDGTDRCQGDLRVQHVALTLKRRKFIRHSVEHENVLSIKRERGKDVSEYQTWQWVKKKETLYVDLPF